MPGRAPSTGRALRSGRSTILLLAFVAALASFAALAIFAAPPRVHMAGLAALILAIGVTGAGLLARDLREREEALRATGRRYRALFERSVAGSAVLDEEGRFLEANHALAEMFGFSGPAELVASSVSDLLGEGGIPRPPGVVHELEVRRRDGSPLHLVLCWGPVDDLETEGEQAVLAAVDVTGQHQRRAQVGALLDAIEEGILTVDRGNRVRFCNRAARRLMQLADDPEREFTTQDAPWELLDARGRPLPPEEYPSARVFRDGRPIRDEAIEVRQADGSSRSLLVSALPYTGSGREVEEVLVSLRDVSERVKTRLFLVESEHRHRAVVDHVGQVIFETDADGVLTFLNPSWARLTGRGVEPSLGQRILNFVHPEDRDPCWREFQAVLSGRRHHCRREVRFLDEAGGERWVEVRARRAIEGRTGSRGLAGVLNDVSERRRLEARIARSRRMEAMGQLAGGVAHDFNNLLTVILGYAQLVQAESQEAAEVPPAVQEGAREIFRTARKAAGLTRQLLTFSRQQILERVVLDVNEVIRRYETLVGRILPASIHCRLELDPELPRVEMSPAQLEQVLLNLVINARDALEGEPHGHLVLRTSRLSVDGSATAAELELEPGEYVAIEVEDTGCGMDEQTRLRVFEPFFTTKEKDRGSGMGLATVYGVVTQAGGRVEVESEPGRGSTFTLYLPAAPSPAEARHAEPR